MDKVLSKSTLWKYYKFGLLSHLLYIHDILTGIGARALEDARSACIGCDIIVFHPLMPFATDIAEAMGVPCIMAGLQPLTPTRCFPHFALTRRYLGRYLNLWSYGLTAIPYFLIRRRINHARRRLLGLNKRTSLGNPLMVRGRFPPAVYSISRALVAPPEDWGKDSLISGYWYSPPSKDYIAPPKLVEFLAAGPKPLYIGFGSNPVGSQDDLIALLLRALQLADLRAVICLNNLEAPSFTSSSDPQRFVVLGPVPHDWLFARVSAAVHHGGAGTVAVSLRAGLPTLVCPLLIDQPWWAERVHELGAGPPPLRYDSLTARTLATRLRDLVSNPDYAAKAAEIARIIAEERGAELAAEFIVTFANRVCSPEPKSSTG